MKRLLVLAAVCWCVGCGEPGLAPEVLEEILVEQKGVGCVSINTPQRDDGTYRVLVEGGLQLNERLLARARALEAAGILSESRRETEERRNWADAVFAVFQETDLADHVGRERYANRTMWSGWEECYQFGQIQLRPKFEEARVDPGSRLPLENSGGSLVLYRVPVAYQVSPFEPWADHLKKAYPEIDRQKTWTETELLIAKVDGKWQKAKL